MGLYRDVTTQVRAIWTAGWTHPDVPVYWRLEDVATLPDPRDTRLWLRNEIQFAQEVTRAFGGGRARNEKMKFGSLIIRVFADIAYDDDLAALDLLDDAETLFRSRHDGNLAFIGSLTGFDDTSAGEEDRDIGNWSMRGTALVWEYRFTG